MLLHAVLPASLVITTARRQVEQEPPLQVGFNVLPLVAGSITSKQIQHLGALQDCFKVPLHQGLQQRARC